MRTRNSIRFDSIRKNGIKFLIFFFKFSNELNELLTERNELKKNKKFILNLKDISASIFPRVVEKRKRSYDNVRIIFFEQFKKLIPVELQSSTIKIIKI